MQDSLKGLSIGLDWGISLLCGFLLECSVCILLCRHVKGASKCCFRLVGDTPMGPGSGLAGSNFWLGWILCQELSPSFQQPWSWPMHLPPLTSFVVGQLPFSVFVPISMPSGSVSQSRRWEFNSPQCLSGGQPTVCGLGQAAPLLNTLKRRKCSTTSHNSVPRKS